MSFERTANGLSNAHLFYSVDFIIYVEGKYAEQNNDLVSYDQYFWKSVSEVVAPDTTFKVLSRGGKPALLSIAHEIILGNISNTLVALDRDYDLECENQLSHPRVIYTLGYSWENDVWHCDGLLGVLDELFLGDEIKHEIFVAFEQCIADFYRNARRVARVNLAAAQNGMEHIVSSSHMRGLIELKRAQLPRFNHQCFRAAIKSSTVARPVRMSSKVELTESHIQGHLLAHFGYHFVCRALSSLGQSARVCIDMLSTIAINHMKTSLRDRQDDKNIYYKQCFSNAVV
jgi:hypothetical protein